jgi:hypothetical protein
MYNLTYNENKRTIKEISNAFKGYCITLIFGTGTKVMYEGTCGWYDKRVPLGYNFDKKKKEMNIYVN